MGSAFSFGRFELLPDQRRLLQAGDPVRLGSRAFDLLVALVQRAGDVVAKDELMAAAWPGTFVEETSLRVHIAALRKVLGEDPVAPHITNVPGRGYCFVAPLTSRQTVDLQPAQPTQQELSRRPRSNLPRLGMPPIGRDDVLSDLLASITRRRVVTLVGPGGIGKTTVAAAAAALADRTFADGVVFTDLTTTGSDRLVPAALAAALGLALLSSDPVAELVLTLRSKQALIVLDNCEHVIEAAATLTEALVGRTGVHVLATSREPLRISGEWVQRLPPLALPPLASGAASDRAVTANEAMSAAAVELFVERAAACLGGYVLTDADAPVVAEICRKLDGMALAIEFAAARVNTMGLEDLVVSLDDGLRLLTQGRRTALPRHQTLRATLDWSYQLLSASEQTVFRRLAVFNGMFTLAAATGIVAGPDLLPTQVGEGVHSLVAKSLIVAETDGRSVRFRLLGTTRSFAWDRLEAAGERARTSRNHAAWLQAVFDRAETEWETRPTAEWLKDYSGYLPNLREALDFAFGPSGDASIGIALTVEAVPLWFESSQVDECLEWVQRALAAVDAHPSSFDRQRMRLHAALGWPSMRAVSGLPSGAAAWSVTLASAEDLGDVDFQLRALWALWVARINAGEPTASLDMADRFCRLEIEGEDVVEHRIGPRLRARTLHLLGQPEEAQAEVESMLRLYVAPANRSHIARFQYDQRVTARITLARVLWIRGLPDTALREVSDNISEAVSRGHVLTLTHALSDGACPVALLAGDLIAADRYTGMLEEKTGVHALDVWHAYSECFRGELLIRRGDAASGVVLLARAIEGLRRAGFLLYRTAFLSVLARGLGRTGRTTEALSIIDDAMTLCERTGEGWCRPELTRIRGRLLLAQGATADAETFLRTSMADAERQGALSWALRSATDLARLLRDRRETSEAADLLGAVHGRFTEGFGTPDVGKAGALLAELR